jgi:hypothetical protein
MREVVPPTAPQQLGRGGVAEDAALLLGEDAVARERAEQAVQRIGVRADLARDLLDRTRPVRERVRDAELGDDGDRTRRHRAAHQIPQDRLRSALAHPREAGLVRGASGVTDVGRSRGLFRKRAHRSVGLDADHLISVCRPVTKRRSRADTGLGSANPGCPYPEPSRRRRRSASTRIRVRPPHRSRDATPNMNWSAQCSVPPIRNPTASGGFSYEERTRRDAVIKWSGKFSRLVVLSQHLRFRGLYELDPNEYDPPGSLTHPLRRRHLAGSH